MFLLTGQARPDSEIGLKLSEVPSVQTRSHGDDLVLIGVRRFPDTDLPAATQYADAVGQFEDLIEAVADDQNADIPLAPPHLSRTRQLVPVGPCRSSSRRRTIPIMPILQYVEFPHSACLPVSKRPTSALRFLLTGKDRRDLFTSPELRNGVAVAGAVLFRAINASSEELLGLRARW